MGFSNFELDLESIKANIDSDISKDIDGVKEVLDIYKTKLKSFTMLNNLIFGALENRDSLELEEEIKKLKEIIKCGELFIAKLEAHHIATLKRIDDLINSQKEGEDIEKDGITSAVDHRS